MPSTDRKLELTAKASMNQPVSQPAVCCSGLIHHLVWLVCVSGKFPPDQHAKQSLTQTNHTRWCINTIWSPDDEHCDARNM